jgi:hypothetical protein
MFFMPGCVVGVAFLLVTFLWPNKEKTLASKGEKQGNGVLPTIQ